MESWYRILCKVRGDQRVQIKSMERVASEMGSVLGNVEEVRDIEDFKGMLMLCGVMICR